jgi:hypothetical protein
VVPTVGAPKRPIDRSSHDLDPLALVVPGETRCGETVSACERDTGRGAAGQAFHDFDKPFYPHHGPRDSARHHQHPGRARLVALRPLPRAGRGRGSGEAGRSRHPPRGLVNGAETGRANMVKHLGCREVGDFSSSAALKSFQRCRADGDHTRTAPGDVPTEIVLRRPERRSNVERRSSTGWPKIGATLGDPSSLVVEQRHNGADPKRPGKEFYECLLGDGARGCCAYQRKLAGGAQRAALRRRA